MLNMSLIKDARLDQLARQLDTLSVQDALDADLGEFAFAVERGAKTLAPKRTGHMASMIQTSKKRKQNATYYEVISTVRGAAPYNFYVHEGTRYIRPRPFMEWGLAYAQRMFNIESTLTRQLEKRLAEHFNK
jgi:HK97 gp10 family phage protein